MLAPGRHGATRSTSERKSNSSSGGACTVISLWMFMAGPSQVHDPLALTPVDGDVRAVDEARARRGEEGDEVRDLLRRADPPERYGLHGQLVRAVLVDALVARERLLEPV